MEEELLNELLAVLGIGSKEIPTVQCKEFFFPPTSEAEPLANVIGSQRWVSHRAEEVSPRQGGRQGVELRLRPGRVHAGHLAL
jgi:hypothetical protein